MYSCISRFELHRDPCTSFEANFFGCKLAYHKKKVKKE